MAYFDIVDKVISVAPICFKSSLNRGLLIRFEKHEIYRILNLLYDVYFHYSVFS